MTTGMLASMMISDGTCWEAGEKVKVSAFFSCINNSEPSKRIINQNQELTKFVIPLSEFTIASHGRSS